MKAFFFASSAALFGSAAAARQLTVYNACPFTIWPALYTDLSAGSAVPSQVTGWEAAAWNAVTFNVPDNWTAGRIWARRNCNFSSNPGPNSCANGGCTGGLVCTSSPVASVPAATTAEFTLSAGGLSDWYAVSLVDGYNLPMRISNNVGCPVASCPVDLGPNCPAVLKGPFDSSGWPLGCRSACAANIDLNQANSPNCCSGSYSTPATCPSTGVLHYSYFKTNCPNSFVYAFDESSGNGIFNCASNKNAQYTVTFCPPP